MRFWRQGPLLLTMLAACEAAGAGTLLVEYADGRISVRAEEVSVKAVLQEIARQAGFRLHLAEGAGEASGIWSLVGLPLEAGLREVVQPDGLLIFYEQMTGGTHITDLHVLPSADKTMKMVSEPSTQAEGDTALRLGHLIAEPGDLVTRRQAIADLVGLEPAVAVRGLETALSVREPDLRQEVVEALGRVYGDVPPTALGQVLFGEGDAGLRRAAIYALASLNSQAARLFLEQALEDKDEEVRSAAAETLGRR